MIGHVHASDVLLVIGLAALLVAAVLALTLAALDAPRLRRKDPR